MTRFKVVVYRTTNHLHPMWLAGNCGRVRETPGVRIINVTGRVGVQIIQRVIETAYAVAPASTANPVLRARGRSVHPYRNFCSEFTIVKSVEVADHIVGPVMIVRFDRFTALGTQARPISGKPLRHPE